MSGVKLSGCDGWLGHGLHYTQVVYRLRVYRPGSFTLCRNIRCAFVIECPFLPEPGRVAEQFEWPPITGHQPPNARAYNTPANRVSSGEGTSRRLPFGGAHLLPPWSRTRVDQTPPPVRVHFYSETPLGSGRTQPTPLRQRRRVFRRLLTDAGLEEQRVSRRSARRHSAFGVLVGGYLPARGLGGHSSSP